MSATKNNWTIPSVLGGTTFDVPTERDLDTCPKKVYGGGYSFGGHVCNRKVVTVIRGAGRGDDGARCAVHAAAVRRRVQNDLARKAQDEAWRERREHRNALRADAAKRLKRHGVTLPSMGDLAPWELADMLDEHYPESEEQD